MRLRPGITASFFFFGLKIDFLCSTQAKLEVQQRLKDMIALESELVNRDIQITSLKDELSQTKASISAQSTRTVTIKVTPFLILTWTYCRAVNRISFPFFLAPAGKYLQCEIGAFRRAVTARRGAGRGDGAPGGRGGGGGDAQGEGSPRRQGERGIREKGKEGTGWVKSMLDISECG